MMPTGTLDPYLRKIRKGHKLLSSFKRGRASRTAYRITKPRASYYRKILLGKVLNAKGSNAKGSNAILTEPIWPRGLIVIDTGDFFERGRPHQLDKF